MTETAQNSTVNGTISHNCPPEDCGGVWGYANFLEAIGDPNHQEHEEFLEWIGGEFDPEEFDLDLVNEILEGLR